MSRHYIFCGVSMILDYLLNLLTKNDFALLGPVFIPCCYLVAFVLTCKQMELFDSLKFAVIIGFFNSLFIPGNFWITIFGMVVIALLIHFWSMNISDSFLELLILSLVIIFFYQSFTFVLQSFKGITNISYIFWCYRFLLPTIVLNTPLTVFVIFAYRSVEERYMERTIEKARTEEMFWHKLKNHS